MVKMEKILNGEKSRSSPFRIFSISTIYRDIDTKIGGGSYH